MAGVAVKRMPWRVEKCCLERISDVRRAASYIAPTATPYRRPRRALACHTSDNGVTTSGIGIRNHGRSASKVSANLLARIKHEVAYRRHGMTKRGILSFVGAIHCRK